MGEWPRSKPVILALSAGRIRQSAKSSLMAGPNCPPSCTLYTKGTGFALTDGTGSNGVLLIGEALGEAEARMSKPFCGDAGLMLGQVLHRLGYRREHFLIGNVINCFVGETLVQAGGIKQAFRRLYKGPLVTLKT